MIRVVDDNGLQWKETGTVQRALQLGCRDTIVKPIIAGQFLQKVRDIIGEGLVDLPPAVVPEEPSEGEVSEEERRVS